MKLRLIVAAIALFAFQNLYSQSTQTYAEKLGFPKDAKVLILHVDDVGMSWESNQGAIQATEKGVANSVSIMMPCPWVPGFVHYMLKNKPTLDAGLHLTLTSEWKDYRWAPVTGKSKSPGLVDTEGAMWSSVQQVVEHSNADEIEGEIRAQIDRAKAIGMEPTHLDSHMGTLFAKQDFMQRYVKVGIELKIPVMLPAGHLTAIIKQTPELEAQKQGLQAIGQMLWASGLPVLDDLHNFSYGFKYPGEHVSDDELRKSATKQYKETIKSLKPGLTMVIMHCTAPSELFPYISDSAKLRKADLLAMTDPEFKKFLEDEKIILTTWREIKARRDKVK